MLAALPACSLGVTVRVSHLFLFILIEQQCIFSFGGAALLICFLIYASLLMTKHGPKQLSKKIGLVSFYRL